MRSKLIVCAALLVAALPVRAGAVLNLLSSPICGVEGGVASTGTPNVLRVANFNVLHGLTEEPPAYPARTTIDTRVDMAAEQLLASGADIIGMEEVSNSTPSDGSHTPGNMVQQIAARMRVLSGSTWHWCWHMANPKFPGEPDIQPGGGGPLSEFLAQNASDGYASFKEGSAILSRYPILVSEARRLPQRTPVEHVLCPAGEIPDCNLVIVFEHRIALWAEIDGPDGPTHIVTTHLSNGITAGSDVSALTQMAAVVALAAEKDLFGPPAHSFITCDCNMTPDVPGFATLMQLTGWADAWAEENPADPGYTGGPDVIVTATLSRPMDERIDYVFTNEACLLTDAGLIVDQPRLTGAGYLWASDHLGVSSDTWTGPTICV